MNSNYAKLFDSVSIGNCKMKNRFAMAPLGPLGLGDALGGFNQRGIDFYVERAKGGTGLIMTGVTFVDDEVEYHGMPAISSTYNPMNFIRTGHELTEKIHAYDAKMFLQLSAGFGRVNLPGLLGDQTPIAPSPIQYRWKDKTCRELTKEEIHIIVKQFGKGARNAKKAGFDGVQIHAVHEGYLLDQFATSFFNNRTDEYGGNLENRLRFAREIVEEIKKECGADFPVAMRYSLKSFIKDWRKGALPGEKFTEKGRDYKEGVEVAKLLEKYGYDALDVDAGCYDSWWWNHPPMYMEKGVYIPFAKMVKEVVNIPVICAGRLDDPRLALKALEDEACDIISLGRPLLTDPDYVNKLRMDEIESIRPCISCHEGCMGRIQEYMSLSCAVNPQACRESDERIVPALNNKKILIVGGGLAGCEAARVLALRGHEPILYEKSERLGGNLIPGGVPSFKEDDRALVAWYEHELQTLGVKIHLNTEMNAETIRASNADAVIIATGSKPKTFKLGSAPVYPAADVLLGKKEAGENVAVIGGGLVGCETALWLREQGKNVTLVEALPKILAVNAPLCHANSEMLTELIPFKGVTTITSAKATDYDGKTLKIETPEGIQMVTADTVVLAVGYTQENSLYEQLKMEIPRIYQIGDARKVSNIMYAIWNAYELASHLD